MKINFASVVGTVMMALMSSGAVSAQPKLDEWRTPITCGGQQFEVVSRCKKSPGSMDLNVCEPGQQLVTGNRSIQIPTGTPVSGKPILFATLWSCLETSHGPVLILDYASGQGRSPDDEDVEFFDKVLRVIKDESTQRSLYKVMAQAKKGYVKSIMPGEEN